MQILKSNKIIKLAFYLSLLLYSAISAADYFAYIPDQSSGGEDSEYLQVVNTKYGVIVKLVPIFGDPREVVLSHKGDYVFVSTVITEGITAESKLNVVSTQANETIIPLSIPHKYVRGITLTKDDSTLFVTHEDGITKIFQPTFTFLQTHLSLEFSGMSMVLSDDDKYLFVIGTDGNNNDGISVVDVSQDPMAEVARYDLGTGAGASSIVFDKSTNELFVLNRAAAQLINLRIDNYDTPSSLTLSPIHVKEFSPDSYPVDLALNTNNDELYVALSYLNEGVGYGDGYITVLNPAEINGEAIYEIITLSEEGGQFAPEPGDKNGFGAIHPLAIAFDNASPPRLHVVKQIWNEYSGTYVSSIDDVYGARSRTRKMTEVDSVHLGKNSSTQITGKFIGPNCSYCPNGLEDETQSVIHPSAINFFMLLFAFIFLIPLRLMQKGSRR